MSQLFRREVMEKQSQKHLGDVFLSSPLSFWAITGLIAVIIAGLVCVTIFGGYARKERVMGVLTPSDGLVQIMPSQTGHFEEVYVDAGDRVKVGAPLLKIKDSAVLTGGRQLSDALLAQMQESYKSLEARLEEIPKEYELKRRRLITRKAELEAEAKRFINQIEVQSRTVELEEIVFRKFKNLMEKGSASEIEVSSAENRFLTATRSLNAFKNDREKVLAQVKDVEAEILMLPVERAQAERDIQDRINTLEQTILKTGVGGSSILHAPVSGTIATVMARKGQQVSAQKGAVSILPEGGSLQAELFVPTRAIGFVKTGQSVRLLYNAFPYQKFGFYDGKVLRVSKTVVTSADIPMAPDLPEPVFLVTVELDRQSIHALGDDIPLQAGMSLSADLILEERKIWEWAFEPLLGALR